VPNVLSTMQRVRRKGVLAAKYYAWYLQAYSKYCTRSNQLSINVSTCMKVQVLHIPGHSQSIFYHFFAAALKFAFLDIALTLAASSAALSALSTARLARSAALHTARHTSLATAYSPVVTAIKHYNSCRLNLTLCCLSLALRLFCLSLELCQS
jgi:hypothetical protein